MELGKTIYEQVKEYIINEESIPKEYKGPLELYMKQKRTSNISSCIKMMVITCELCSSTFTYKSSLKTYQFNAQENKISM